MKKLSEIEKLKIAARAANKFVGESNTLLREFTACALSAINSYEKRTNRKRNN